MDKEIKKLLQDNLLKVTSTDFTARTMQKIHEIQEWQPKKRKISRFFLISPLAAAPLLVLFLVFFLPWGSPNTISWADVQKQIEQVHTITYITDVELVTPDSNVLWSKMKVYMKDPGRFRCEIYETGGGDDIPDKPQWVSILKSEPGMRNGLTLHPDSSWAEMWDEIFHAYGQEPATKVSGGMLGRILQRKNLNYALETWENGANATENETSPVGKRLINGIPAVGFGFAAPQSELGLEGCEQMIIPPTMWVGRDDGLPLLFEMEFKTCQDVRLRVAAKNFQWNIPIDENLFKLTVPDGWGLSRHLYKSIEFTNIGFSPNVTMEIGPEGQGALVGTGDIAGLVKAEQSTAPGRDPDCAGLITIELTPSAAKRLRDYVDANPGRPLIVNFNGQIASAAKLEDAHPTRLSFDITQLGLSMFKLEEGYTTAAIEKNKS